MRAVALVLAIVAIFLAIAALSLTLRAGPTPGLQIVGDRAFEVHAAVDRLTPQPAIAAGEDAALHVTLVDDWAKLVHIPGTKALCGELCDGLGAPDLVRAIHLSARRKHLLIRIAERDDPACLAQVIYAETRRLRGPSDPVACFQGAPSTRWILPFGLGSI